MNSSNIIGSWGFTGIVHDCENTDRDFYHFLPNGSYVEECCVFPPKQSVMKPKAYTLENDTLELTRGIGTSKIKVASIGRDTMELIDSRGLAWTMNRIASPKPFMRRLIDSKGKLQNLDAAEQDAAANP